MLLTIYCIHFPQRPITSPHHLRRIRYDQGLLLENWEDRKQSIIKLELLPVERICRLDFWETKKYLYLSEIGRPRKIFPLLLLFRLTRLFKPAIHLRTNRDASVYGQISTSYEQLELINTSQNFQLKHLAYWKIEAILTKGQNGIPCFPYKSDKIEGNQQGVNAKKIDSGGHYLRSIPGNDEIIALFKNAANEYTNH